MSANTRDVFKKLQPLVALLVMVVALSFLSKTFLTLGNQLNILSQISVNLCLSIGMTLIVLTGGIDLSVGAILAVAGAVAASVFKNGLALKAFGIVLQFTFFGAIVAGLVAGIALGWFNGFVITRFKLPPFVATLGMLSIARGFTMLWTGGFPVTDLGPQFAFIGVGFWLGVPMTVWISAALVVVFHIVSRSTRLGRYIYAVGGSARAAKYSGVDVKRVEIWVYSLGGGLSAVGGLLLTAHLNAADPKAGLGYELDSIAAVVIGGTSLSGGRGSIPGTVLGCLIIGVLNNGLVLLNVSPFWQQVVKGFVIIAAVAADKIGVRTE